MNATASALLMRNFNEIFIELDPRQARRIARRVLRGRLSLDSSRRAEIQTMHNLATCRWGSGMPGQPFHYTGPDFLEERDGRVSRLYTFIDQKRRTAAPSLGTARPPIERVCARIEMEPFSIHTTRHLERNHPR